MTWYEITLLILAGLLLIPIVVVFFKHFPEIAAIETKQIPEEKQHQVKVIMAEQRLYRKFKHWFGVFAKFFKPLVSLVKTIIDNWQGKLKELEKKYKIESLTIKSATDKGKESLQQKINILIKQAYDFFDHGEYGKAEDNLIQVVELDPKSIEAFEGLGEIYFEQKKYNEAKEIYAYILKMMRDQDADSIHLEAIKSDLKPEEKNKVIITERAKIYFQLSEVYNAEGNIDKAFEQCKKSLKLEPNNPKYLDAAIGICIIKKDKTKAQELFFNLKSVNPENKKLTEIEERINEL